MSTISKHIGNFAGYFSLLTVSKYILLFLLINFNEVAYNQVIKGTILDQKTHSIINFASVYFNGTFVGTNSDQNGNFELDISKNISMPLTISALGYYSVTLTDFPTDKALLIYLTPKIFELKEIVVNAKFHAGARNANLKLFKNEFLGTTGNALYCKITNEKDILFNFDSDNDTLKAFSSEPILIDNKALGYKITYYLDRFEFCTKSNSGFFIGNIIFREDSTTKKIQKQRFERRRKYAYLGSRMQFFRALWKNNLDSTGFFTMDSSYAILNYNNLVIQTDSLTKYLKYTGNLGISYYRRLPTSYITFLKESVYFDKNGYFDPSGISWDGEMAKQRIADWLPYEYSNK